MLYDDEKLLIICLIKKNSANVFTIQQIFIWKLMVKTNIFLGSNFCFHQLFVSLCFNNEQIVSHKMNIADT